MWPLVGHTRRHHSSQLTPVRCVCGCEVCVDVRWVGGCEVSMWMRGEYVVGVWM